MALYDDLKLDYARLRDPNYIKELIAQNQMNYRPELEKTFGSIDARLNRQGMFSASPVTTARYRAAGEFNRDIAKMTEEQIMTRWQTILPLLAQMEQADKEGRRQDKAGWLKLIGTVLGAGAGFLIDGPPGAAIGAGAGGSIGSMNAPSMQVNSPYYPR